jgi:hypothetical protein
VTPGTSFSIARIFINSTRRRAASPPYVDSM